MRGKNALNKNRQATGMSKKLAPGSNGFAYNLQLSPRAQNKVKEFAEQVSDDFLIITELDLPVGKYVIDKKTCGEDVLHHLYDGDYQFDTGELIVEDVKKNILSQKTHRKYTFNFTDGILLGYDHTNNKRCGYRASNYQFSIELLNFDDTDNHDNDLYKITNAYDAVILPEGTDFRPDIGGHGKRSFTWDISEKSWTIPWDSTGRLWFKSSTTDAGRPKINTLMATNASKGAHTLFYAGFRGAILAWADLERQKELTANNTKSKARKSPLTP